MTWDIHQGDALAVLRTLPRESVQCIVTSPPYWGLRDYGVAGQIGLEATPEEFIGKLVEVFREAREVLRRDGVAWVNMGDCYATNPGFNRGEGHCGEGGRPHKEDRDRSKIPGLKPKDLVGQPWRLAFALQADGWWLRSDCIWAKPNPMPESVTDRPTKAHEYVFLLTKAEGYFYDAEAVKEQSVDPESYGPRKPRGADQPKSPKYSNPLLRTRVGDSANGKVYERRQIRTVWSIPTDPFPGSHFATFPKRLAERCILAGSRPGDLVLDPFCGAGTTGLVALRHGRSFVGIELNAEYVAMAKRRIVEDAPLFNQPVQS